MCAYESERERERERERTQSQKSLGPSAMITLTIQGNVFGVTHSRTKHWHRASPTPRLSLREPPPPPPHFLPLTPPPPPCLSSVSQSVNVLGHSDPLPLAPPLSPVSLLQGKPGHCLPGCYGGNHLLRLGRRVTVCVWCVFVCTVLCVCPAGLSA